MRYGELVRSVRIKKEMSLREFAAKTDIDVAYLSRIERCTIPPPQKSELLDAIAGALELSESEAAAFKDQAAIDNERIPKDIAESLKGVVGIPMLLRSIGNKKLNTEELQKLINTINEQY